MSIEGKIKIVEQNHMVIEKIPSGPFEANAYTVTCPHAGESILVDAPHGLEQLKHLLEELNLKMVLLTHGHFDHTASLENLAEHFKIPVAVHENDASSLTVIPGLYLDDGENISVGNITVEVMHTPGHTGGSLCFIAGDYVICGDTVFPGGPGKTSSPESFNRILHSIKDKIFTLPGDTLLLPGHGNYTTVKREKELFDSFEARGHQPGLYGDVTWI